MISFSDSFCQEARKNVNKTMWVMVSPSGGGPCRSLAFACALPEKILGIRLTNERKKNKVIFPHKETYFSVNSTSSLSSILNIDIYQLN